MANANPEKDNVKEKISTEQEHTEENEEGELDTETEEHTQTEEMPELEHIKGTETGLQIITMASTGSPKETIALTYITTSIDKGLNKWTYSNKTYKEEDVMHYVKTNQINLQDSFKIVQWKSK